MSTLSDYDENVQCYILQQFQRAAVNRHHHRWLHGYGFNAAMINQLARLPTETLLKLARSNPIRLSTSQLFSDQLSRLTTQAETEQLAMTALRLGASRRMLGDLLGINEAEYKRLKKMANLPAEERNRPHALSSNVQDFLAQIHGNLLASYRRQNRDEPHPLEILISMAQVSDIEINRIYEGYFLKNTDLFRQKAAGGGDGL